METLSIANKDQDDLIHSHVMTAPPFISDFIETIPKTFCHNANVYLPSSERAHE